MKKITFISLLSILFAITISSAKDVNTIQINDDTKPKIDLMAEIMKLDKKEKLLDKENASLEKLGNVLDELKDSLLTKNKK